MGTGVNFELRLKDMMSGALPKVERAARSAFGGVDAAIGKVRRSLDGIGGSSRKVQNDLGSMGNAAVKSLDSITAAATRANKAVNNVSSGSRGNSFLRTAGAMGLGSLAAGGIMAAGGFAIDQGKQTINAGLQGSSIKAQFETMNGKAAGGQLYSDLTKYIQDSIFGNELYKEGGMLNSFGIGAGDILPTLKMLGDVSGGDKERLHGLALAYAQVTAAGKMQGQDKMQFVNAGFNPAAVLAEKTGKSQEYYNDLMSQGKFTSEMVKQAFMSATGVGGRYHGNLDAIGATPYGKYQAMQGNLDNAKLQLGTALLPTLSRLMDAMKPRIDGLPRMMEQLAPYGERFGTALEEVLPMLQSFGSGIGRVLKPFAEFALSDPMKELAKNALAAASSLAGLAGDILNLAGKVATPVVSAANGLYETVGVLMERIPKAFTDTWRDLTGRTDKQRAVDGQLDYSGGGGAATREQVLDMLSRGKIDGRGFHAAPTAPAKAAKPSATDTATDVSNSIVGGGARPVTLNFNAPLYKVDRQDFHTVAAAVDDMEPKVQEAMNRILSRMRTAMG
jgi:tape measure domain-containing protein